MMNKYCFKVFVVLTMCLLFSFYSNACDACGCNLGVNYFGITPAINQHFIGSRFLISRYYGELHEVHDHDGVLEEHHESSNDTYLKNELISRIRITSRLHLGFLLPYQVSIRDGQDHRSTIAGFGDPSLIAYFNPLMRTQDSDWKHTLLLGAGMKAPMGNHKASSDGELVHQNAQIGTGSFDWITSINYTVRYKQVGLNTEQTLKLNGENSQGYKYGNQITSSVNFFYWFQSPSLVILPVAGVLYERAGRHFDNQVANENSGGKVTYMNLGTQLFLRTWGLNAFFQAPLVQRFHTEEGGSITSKNRFSLGITKSFGKSG